MLRGGVAFAAGVLKQGATEVRLAVSSRADDYDIQNDGGTLPANTLCRYSKNTEGSIGSGVAILRDMQFLPMKMQHYGHEKMASGLGFRSMSASFDCYFHSSRRKWDVKLADEMRGWLSASCRSGCRVAVRHESCQSEQR